MIYDCTYSQMQQQQKVRIKSKQNTIAYRCVVIKFCLIYNSEHNNKYNKIDVFK